MTLVQIGCIQERLIAGTPCNRNGACVFCTGYAKASACEIPSMWVELADEFVATTLGQILTRKPWAIAQWLCLLKGNTMARSMILCELIPSL